MNVKIIPMNLKILSALMLLLAGILAAGCTQTVTQTVTPPVVNGPFVPIVTMVERTTGGAAVSAVTSSYESYWVILENFQFMPRDLEIQAGDTIEWVNKGDETYTFQLSDLLSARLSPGSRVEYTFHDEGQYQFTGRLLDEDEQEDHARMIYGAVLVD